MRGFYLLLAAVDLPFLLCRQGEHGFPVFFCEVKLILQNGGKIAEKCWWGALRRRGRIQTITSQCFIDCLTEEGGGIILKTSQLTDKLSNHHATYPHKSTLFFTPQTKTRARSSCTRSLLSAQDWFVLNLFTIGGISTWIQYNSESNQMSCRP